MSALLADKDLALNLSIHQGAPVLERAMTYLDPKGAILLTGRSLHRGDLVSCAFELPLDGPELKEPNLKNGQSIRVRYSGRHALLVSC